MNLMFGKDLKHRRTVGVYAEIHFFRDEAMQINPKCQ